MSGTETLTDWRSRKHDVEARRDAAMMAKIHFGRRQLDAREARKCRDMHQMKTSNA